MNELSSAKDPLVNDQSIKNWSVKIQNNNKYIVIGILDGELWSKYIYGIQFGIKTEQGYSFFEDMWGRAQKSKERILFLHLADMNPEFRLNGFEDFSDDVFIRTSPAYN